MKAACKPLAKLTIEERDGVASLVSDGPMYRLGPPGVFGGIGPEGSYVLEVAAECGDRAWAAFTMEELIDIARGSCPDCGGDLGGDMVGRIESHAPECPRFPL